MASRKPDGGLVSLEREVYSEHPLLPRGLLSGKFVGPVLSKELNLVKLPFARLAAEPVSRRLRDLIDHVEAGEITGGLEFQAQLNLHL
jgi:hypothetical protein